MNLDATMHRIHELDRLYLKALRLFDQADAEPHCHYRRQANRAWRAYVQLRDDKADYRRCVNGK